MESLSDSKGPLTIERVLKLSSNELFVIFDFKYDEWEAPTQVLKAYWQTWAEHHSVPRVSFLFADDITHLERQALNKGHYVVYGLFEPEPSHFISDSFKDTPFNIWEEELKDLAARGLRDIGFAAVGRNSLGEGFIVAFTASNPVVLADMQEHLLMNHTFISIFQGQIISGGALNHNFMPIALSACEAQDDADYFFATLEKVHPQLLRHISIEDYLDSKKTIRTQLLEQEMLQGSISSSYLAGILAEAAAYLKDGHTGIKSNGFFISEDSQDIFMLPFRLKRNLDYLIVEYVTPDLEDLQGQTLITINDQPMDDFLKPALRRISSESDTFGLEQFVDRQRFYSAWCGLFSSSPVTIRFKNKRHSFTRSINLISLQEYDELIPERDESPSFHCFYHDDKICYYQYNSFIDCDSERSYIVRLFSEMQNRGTSFLIIDLRINTGGDPDMGDYLLSFLTEKPYRMWSRVDIKLSEHLFEQRTEFTPYRDLAGLILSELVDPKTPKRQEYLFKGNLYLLIGPGTFSAATEFAAVVKNYHLGQLIGEETGGRRQSTGDALMDQLPSSAIGFSVSSMVYYASIPNTDDEYRGVLPDVSPIAEDLIKHEETDDPLLYFTLDHVH